MDNRENKPYPNYERVRSTHPKCRWSIQIEPELNHGTWSTLDVMPSPAMRIHFVSFLVPALLLVGCHQRTTPKWSHGEWTYNSEATIRQKAPEVEKDAMHWQSLLDIDADNAGDRLVVSDDLTTLFYSNLTVEFRLVKRSIDQLTFRGTGENDIGTLTVHKVDNDRIEIFTKLMSGPSSSIGIFDRKR